MKGVFYVFLFTVLLGCKDKQASIDKKEFAQSLDKVDTKAPFIVYRVRVENLRMREQSDKKSEVIDKLEEGSVLRGRGLESKNREKVVLRGITYNEPYCKVEKEDGSKGWVYKGGLSQVYVSDREDPFTGELENLILAFDRIKAKAGIARGQEIMRLVFNQRSDTPEWNDVLFKLAYDELVKLEKDTSMWNILESIEWEPDAYEAIYHRRFDMNSSVVSRRFQSAGMMLDAGEGMVYQMIDINKIAAIIGGPFTEAMTAFVTFESQSQKQKLITDATFIGRPEDLISGIAKRENFLKRHEFFVMNRELESQLLLLHSIVLEGTANSPIFDYETGQLNPSWMDIWKKYLIQLPEGRIADKIKTKLKQVEGN